MRTKLCLLALLATPLLQIRAQSDLDAQSGAPAPTEDHAGASSMPGVDQGRDTSQASAEDRHHRGEMNPEGMSQPGMDMGPHSSIDQMEQHATAGTDAEPLSTPVEMVMAMRRNWTLMLHGQAFLNEIQQSGPRGADKLFSTNWIMAMMQHRSGSNQFTLRTMLSLEPATISGRFYPELFQQGETAFGRPIVDGQHPHDFFMELAAVYDRLWGDRTLLTVYVAPMGDPALGPLAYPHRASASEDPIAPLGHHLQDSTHIAADVITLALSHRSVRWEASAFHGREPDEERWNVNHGKIDSWSSRATVYFNPDWSFQFSLGQLHSPEALQPLENLRRITSSLMYNRALAKGNWATMLLWGRNQSLWDGNVGNSYLAESTLRFRRRNAVWTRIENVDRTNQLELAGEAEPAAFVERYFARVQAYTAGYDREFVPWPHLGTAIGAQISGYGVPRDLQSAYGSHPWGAVLFLRLRVQ